MTDFSKISKKLKKARELKGLEISDISRKIKIRKQYLTAIEENDFDVIPGKAYVEGYIKLYSEFLNLSEEVKKELVNKAPPPKRKIYRNVKKHIDNSFFIGLLFFAIAILLIILLFSTGAKKSRRDEVMEYLFEEEYIIKK